MNFVVELKHLSFYEQNIVKKVEYFQHTRYTLKRSYKLPRFNFIFSDLT